MRKVTKYYDLEVGDVFLMSYADEGLNAHGTDTAVLYLSKVLKTYADILKPNDEPINKVRVVDVKHISGCDTYDVDEDYDIEYDNEDYKFIKYITTLKTDNEQLMEICPEYFV